MLTAVVANGFNASSTFDLTKLHQRPVIHPTVVSMDMDMGLISAHVHIQQCSIWWQTVMSGC